MIVIDDKIIEWRLYNYLTVYALFKEWFSNPDYTSSGARKRFKDEEKKIPFTHKRAIL